MADKKGKILWLTERYPPLKGGMSVSCARQVRELRRRDRELDVFAFTLPETDKISRLDHRDNGDDFIISRNAHPGVAAQWAWSQVRSRNISSPYKIAVGFGANFPGYLATTFAAWLGVPSIVLVRGNDFDRDRFDRRLCFQVHDALSRASIIGCVSPDKSDQIKALYPAAKTFWTPNGVEPQAAELLAYDMEKRDSARSCLSADGRRVIGIFGELKFKKRIPLFLEAIRDAGLKERIGLLVVGRADSETEQILVDPVLSPLCSRIPFCDRRELPGLYAACDFIALPSLFEGMPNVLLEAMALGVAPIASDAGAMKNVIDDGVTGFLFPAEDRAGAADAVERAVCMTDAELAEMSDRVKNRIKNEFSLEREINTICELIDSCT